MIPLLILAATSAAPATMTAIDAERAFARDAKRGQWTAFRKWADRDAVMFTPQAVWARTFLKKLKDPPHAISWRPADSYVSCDGRTAVNTGPWFQQDGNPGGYFTTVWQQTKGSWRWVYDGGGPQRGAAATGKPRTHRASCKSRAPGAPIIAEVPASPKQARTTPVDSGRGESADKTLGWDWKVEKSGARRFRVYQWTGSRYVEVIHNDVPAPRKK
jgi:hypothetical protein